MWNYQQSTGTLKHDGSIVCTTGYSGHGNGVNCCAMQNEPDVGPIPCGVYAIGVAEDHPRLGPCSMPLTQVSGESFGRSGFFIHGDNACLNKTGSEGCVILPPDVRRTIASSSDRSLEVVP